MRAPPGARSSALPAGGRAWHDVRVALPTDPIHTARLVLTPVVTHDVADVALLHGDPLVERWTGPWTQATTTTWVHEMAERWARDQVGKWLVRDRQQDLLVGRGGFTRFDLDGEAVLELGWAVRDNATGRGYATEIGRAALEWAARFYPGLPVIAFTEVHNLASRAVMRRLGLRDAGLIHREGLVEGRVGLQPDAPFALYRQG